MLTKEGVRCGARLVLDYPVHNRLGVPLEYLERRIEVKSVRSIADEPLSLESFLLRPFLRRGVTLIEATEEGIRRRFYWECRKEGTEAGLQFVLVDEDEEWHEPVGRVYDPEKSERLAMLEIVRELEVPAGYTLAIRAVS